jgi:hypothetical protein
MSVQEMKSTSEHAHERPSGRASKRIRETFVTGSLTIGSTMVVWAGLVWASFFAVAGRYPIALVRKPVWAGSLWLSAICCTAFWAWRRCAKNPQIGSLAAFAFFAIVYIASEGPIFGDAEEGGDPATTNLVVWNLAILPFGVYLTAEFVSKLACRRAAHKAVRQASDHAAIQG